MTTWELLTSAWDWKSSVVLGCTGLLLGYLGFVPRRPPARTLTFFLSGVVLLLLDLVSPLDALGDQYLLSAHVAQHFLLALVIPILFLVGTSPTLAAAALEVAWVRGVESVLSRPACAWLAGVVTMLGWHVPILFNAALENEPIHVMQHLSFLASGMIFWWPVFSPLRERRLAALTSVFYLFGACSACSLLGAALTFSSRLFYPAYLNPEDLLGTLSLIRGGWGLDAKSDQQLAGLLMWVAGCFVYLGSILFAVARWYGEDEVECELEREPA